VSQHLRVLRTAGSRWCGRRESGGPIRRPASRSLAGHLPAGTAADPEQAALWTASEQGKQFLSASSLRWRDADIAAGADEAQARAAAASTGNG
jgi:hypothetical protein